MTHTCHAAFCERRTPQTMFMCRKHWLSLPYRFQRAVTSSYRRGQCDDWQITNEYADAAQAAIREIAIREGRRPLPDDDPALRLYDVLRPDDEVDDGADDGGFADPGAAGSW